MQQKLLRTVAARVAPSSMPTASAACRKVCPAVTSDTTSAGSLISAHARKTESGTPAAISQKD